MNASGLTGNIKSNYVEGAMSGASIDNNGFFSGGTSGAAFVNPSTLNFWPTIGSILRNTANATYAPTLDFNQTTRTSPYDVGAYETEGLASNPGWVVGPGFKTTTPTAPDTTPPAAPQNLSVTGVPALLGGVSRILANLVLSLQGLLERFSSTFFGR